MSTLSVPIPVTSNLKPLKATSWLETALLFGIPAIALYAAFHFLSPSLANNGLPLAEARFIAIDLVIGGMLLAAIIGFLLEGQPATWSAFSKRFRLQRMDRRGWLWTIGGLVAFVLLAIVTNTVFSLIYQAIGFTPPIDTAEPFGRTAIPLALFSLLLNILGEEFWWRGYILPRQELQLGRHTWIVHGILWAWFHVFKWWTVPALMIYCLLAPYIAQKTKNTYPGILAHLLINGLGLSITIIQLLVQ
jgi:membrane protease YdiL (CAAX protease family)